MEKNSIGRTFFSGIKGCNHYLYGEDRGQSRIADFRTTGDMGSLVYRFCDNLFERRSLHEPQDRV